MAIRVEMDTELFKWIYIGILLGAHYIVHISRIRVEIRPMEAKLLHAADEQT